MTRAYDAACSGEASPAEVWERLRDGRAWSDWNPAVEWFVVEGALEPGGVVTIKPRRGRQTALLIEAALSERLLVLLVTIGPLAALRLRWEIAPAGSGSRVTQFVTVEGPLAGPFLGRMAARIAAEMEASLALLTAARGVHPR